MASVASALNFTVTGAESFVLVTTNGAFLKEFLSGKFIGGTGFGIVGGNG